jgi:signal transduction histidine kinase
LRGVFGSAQLEQPLIYADAAAIILRLAIRNFLENVLKYSPSGSPILFEMVTDEEKLPLVIRVTNTRKKIHAMRRHCSSPAPMAQI